MNTRTEGNGVAAMDLQRELRHKSEDLDDLFLLDVVTALRRRVCGAAS